MKGVSFLLCAALAGACGKKDEDGAVEALPKAPITASEAAEPVAPAAAQPANAKVEASATRSIVGASKKDCNAGGNGWIAVRKTPNATDLENRAAVCEGSLVAWPCCAAQVIARFPEAALDGAEGKSGLSSLLARYGTDGYKLYNCTAGDAQTQLHFLRIAEDGRWLYRRIQFTSAEVEPAGDAGACSDAGAAGGGAGIDLGVDAVADGAPSAPAPAPVNPASPQAPSTPSAPVDTTPKLTFAVDANPVITASCAGGACHGQDAFSETFRYVGSEVIFRQAKAKVIDRISRAVDAGGRMPPKASGKTLSDADKQKLVDFLSQ